MHTNLQAEPPIPDRDPLWKKAIPEWIPLNTFALMMVKLQQQIA